MFDKDYVVIWSLAGKTMSCLFGEKELKLHDGLFRQYKPQKKTTASGLRFILAQQRLEIR